MFAKYTKAYHLEKNTTLNLHIPIIRLILYYFRKEKQAKCSHSMLLLSNKDLFTLYNENIEQFNQILNLSLYRSILSIKISKSIIPLESIMSFFHPPLYRPSVITYTKFKPYIPTAWQNIKSSPFSHPNLTTQKVCSLFGHIV